MKASKLLDLRFDSKNWPRYVRSWDDIPPNSSSIVVDRKLSKTLEPLSRFKRLQNLFVHGLREQDLASVAAVGSLKRLLVWRLDTCDLKGLRSLTSLQSLGVYHAAKLESFAGLEALRALRHIFFHHIPNVRSLSPLRGLSNLQEIVLEMSWATTKPLSFETLKPLQNLPRLSFLDLRGIQVIDGSLRPIASLPAIRHLFPGSYAFDVQELAFLAAKLNRQLVKEDQILPTRKPKRDDDFGKCNKCGAQQHQLIGKIGKKYRSLACPKCDQALIAERVAIFESVASKVNRRPRS